MPITLILESKETSSIACLSDQCKERILLKPPLVGHSSYRFSGGYSKNPSRKLSRRSSTHTHTCTYTCKHTRLLCSCSLVKKRLTGTWCTVMCIHAVHLFLGFTLALQSCCVCSCHELGVSIHPKYSPDRQMHKRHKDGHSWTHAHTNTKRCSGFA